MNRADIRIIDQQSEEIHSSEPNIPDWEKEQLLRKYGYDSTPSVQEDPNITPNHDPMGDIPYGELCRREDERIRREEYEKRKRLNGPKPITFDGNYDSNTNYSQDGDSGFSFKVDIVSDMKIPKG